MSVNIAGASGGSNVQLENVILDVYTQEILFKAQPVMRFESVCVKKNDLSVLPGNTMKFLKYNSLTGSSALVEITPIVPDTISTSTVSISVSEQGKALSFSELLLRSSITDVLSDAAQLLGMHYAKERDGQIRDVLSAGANIKYSQKAGAAASRASLVSGSSFDVNLIRDSVEFLATQKAPKWNGDAYICFVHPHQARFLRADPAWINVSNYAAPENQLNGEIGRIEDVRFIESTQVTYIANGTQNIWADGADTGNNTVVAANSATDVYRAIMCGDYAIGLAESLPVEMRDNGVEDFGRTHSLGYYGIWGMGLIETGHSVILETS